MLSDAAESFREILSPPFRAVLGKSLAITIGLLVVLWIALDSLAANLIQGSEPWLYTTLSILTGAGLFLGLGFLVAPTTSLIAGLFLDEIAEVVEKTSFPADPPGTAVPLGTAMAVTAKFTLVVLLANIVALLLLLVPGVNLIAFLVVNAYLIGREYFEAAAVRFRSPEEARALRRAHGLRVFLGGLIVSVVLAIPIVNLVTPLFATAFMVRLHKRISRGA